MYAGEANEYQIVMVESKKMNNILFLAVGFAIGFMIFTMSIEKKIENDLSNLNLLIKQLTINNGMKTETK